MYKWRNGECDVKKIKRGLGWVTMWAYVSTRSSRCPGETEVEPVCEWELPPPQCPSEPWAPVITRNHREVP